MEIPLIELKDITNSFDNQIVLRGVSLNINDNEFVTLLGPSGCGKTTLLRIIGGFETPGSGDVLFCGKSIVDVPAHKRQTNTVFQKYALFPHLNVFENIAFPLRIKNYRFRLKEAIKKLHQEFLEKSEKTKDKIELKELKKTYKAKVLTLKHPNAKIDSEIKMLKRSGKTEDNLKKIAELKKKRVTAKSIEVELSKKVLRYLKLVGLQGFENREVSSLSGGQQQRVAIARALINEPKVLLLDEPLAALDLKTRQEMQYELKEMQKNAGITFIFVTHDQEEALTMSDKIVVMNKGEIQQIGTPVDIYNEPVNRFVARFIGESNIIPATMKDDFLVCFDHKELKCVDSGFSKNQAVEVVLRPEDIDIVKKGTGKFTGVTDSVAFKGIFYEIDVQTKDRLYTIHTTDYVPVGKEVDIDFNPEDIHVMEKENE